MSAKLTPSSRSCISLAMPSKVVFSTLLWFSAAVFAAAAAFFASAALSSASRLSCSSLAWKLFNSRISSSCRAVSDEAPDSFSAASFWFRLAQTRSRFSCAQTQGERE